MAGCRGMDHSTTSPAPAQPEHRGWTMAGCRGWVLLAPMATSAQGRASLSHTPIPVQTVFAVPPFRHWRS